MCRDSKGFLNGPALALHPSGQVWEVAQYRDDEQRGAVLWLDESGVPDVIRIIDPSSDRETTTHYYPDGRLKIHAEWLNEDLDGHYRNWYPDGQIKIDGNNRGGKRDGTWMFWTPSGEIEATVVYDHGTEISRKP